MRATVRLHNTAETISADPAWVVVAPPDFAPAIENLVTLYDAVYAVMARFDPTLAVGDATTVSFTRDIYPILRRISNLHWVSKVAARHHGEGKRTISFPTCPCSPAITPIRRPIARRCSWRCARRTARAAATCRSCRRWR